jgi:modulator of FtsH protease HflC
MPRSISFLGMFLMAALLLILFGQPLYIVKEGTQAVITQFGEPLGDPVTKAGLHLKMPFVQMANRFEKRLMEWDGDPTKIPTKDKRFIWINSMARWRIVDPLKFLKTVRNETQAQSRLDDVIESQTKTIVSGQTLIEIVRNSNRVMEIELFKGEGTDGSDLQRINEIRYGRNYLTREILERSKEIVKQFGIELLDMRIKRINYTDEVREKIYERMIAERRRAAEQFRSEGQGRKAEIEGRMARELDRITSEAYRTAQESRGKADAEATKIYAKAYQSDPEFYNFVKTLKTYESTIDGKTTLVLTTDSDYFKYLKRVTPLEP